MSSEVCNGVSQCEMPLIDAFDGLVDVFSECGFVDVEELGGVVVEDSSCPGVAEVEANQGRDRVLGGGWGGGGVAAVEDFVGEARQSASVFFGERHGGFGEIGECHGGIESNVRVALGEVEEVAVFGHAHVGDDERQSRMFSQEM